MSYPVYKLLRQVNRQYPNNGFINYVDVNEDIYPNMIVDEDMRDIINECLQEIYKDVALDEVFSFPTVPGQVEYALPEDCDLRDIQEVTRWGYNANHRPLGPVPPIEKIMHDEWEKDEFAPDSDYPDEFPGHRPEPCGYPYKGWVPNHFWFSKRARRLVWARDAEELTGDRYFNAWDNKRIGIMPVPTTPFEVIKIYYKKKPKEIVYMDDEIQIKEKFMPILKYRVCMELAASGSNPDVDMYNVFANQYNTLLLEAKRDKDSDQPYYQHIKDNRRPMDYFRRRPWRNVRW